MSTGQAGRHSRWPATRRVRSGNEPPAGSTQASLPHEHLPRVSQIWDTRVVTVGVSRDIIWISSSLEELKRFPEPVKKVMGFALFQAQRGGRHLQTKPLKGFGVQASSRSSRTSTGTPSAPCTPSALRMLTTYCTRSRRDPRRVSRPRSARWTWCEPGSEWLAICAKPRRTERKASRHERRHA